MLAKLPQAEPSESRQLAKLRHEYALLRELDADGVVGAHALERYGSGLALIMADPDPGAAPLSELLRRGRLPIAKVLHLAIELAEIVGGLHQRGIIHKNLNPQSILFNEATDHVHLMDFSIATRLSQETQSAAAPETLEGVLAYMSPEQTGRMNRALDTRTDLYSLGVTLYEALTGVLPFESGDAMSTIHSHIARTPRSPAERIPELPRTLSELVMKLLAKSADSRYQTARGLRADLKECLERWQASGDIEPFPMGRHDRISVLRLPQKLYGRADELDALMAAFERVRQGTVELLLIAGYSGVGKSSLIQEIHKGIARRGGYFVAGKFDQLSRTIPYGPIAQAFGALVRMLLTESASRLQTWKEKLLSALGPNGRLLTDLIPELALIIGAQPPIPALGPGESQNRFTLVFQNFLRVFTSPEHPLILSLDDLQWADPASLRLMHILLTDPASSHLLVIGAYRDNEVTAAHPLPAALDALRKTGAQVSTITLRALDIANVTEIVADSLEQAPERVRPLAQLAFDKTEGNPFFLGQFLMALHHNGLLVRDAGTGDWSWELQRIQAAQLPDDIVDFIASKLQRLPAGTRHVLRLAACIGHQFDIRTLSIINEQPATETAGQLWEALREGLIVPLDSAYRFLSLPAAPDADSAAAATDFQVSYRFLHDRVQQAAYSLIAPADKQTLHLRIGRLMLVQLGAEQESERLFDLVNHFNIGASLLTDPSERRNLANLNLLTGKRAKSANAYQAAAGYLKSGKALLDPTSWEHDHALAFALHIEAAECVALTGDFAQAETLFEELLERVRSPLERARVYNLRIVHYTTLGRYAEAMEFGRAALAQFSIELPEELSARKAAVAAELAAVQVNLAGRRIADLIDAPVLADPSPLMTLELLLNLTATAYLIDPAQLYLLVVVKQVNLSLLHGQSHIADHAYMCYGFVLAAILGRYQEGYEFGKLALAMNTRMNNADLTCKLNFLFGVYVPFFRPLRESLAYSARSHQSGLETGDFIYLSFACHQTLLARIGLGDGLRELRAEADKYLVLMQRTKEALSTGSLTVSRQLAASLQGQTRDRYSLSDSAFDEAEFIAAAKQAGFAVIVCWYYTARLELLCFYGEYAAALDMATNAEEWAARSAGYYFTTELAFYAGLTLAILSRGATGADRARYAERLAAHQARLATWAENCPENFRHKLLLIDAERARADGQDYLALELYEQAIELAHENQFPHHEALASELYARFHLDKRREKLARVYLLDAYQGYLSWGATAKASQLAEAYPYLLPRPALPADASPVDASPGSPIQPPAIADLLNVETALRAAQAIATEVELDKVLEQLMRVVIANAGAQRGFLLLMRQEVLAIAAAISVDPDTVRVGLLIPVEECEELAVTVVQYVARTRETVVLGDASRDERFASTPYILKRKPRSILCVPLVHQGRLSGVLYVENNAAYDAFTQGHTQLLGLLCSQAAIAVENAMLYARIHEARAQMQRANERLEQEVHQRTEQLSEANARLQGELVQREKAEQRRAALQEELIRVQRDMLAEMSTPLIPITDRIMVMPLIGVMDAARAEQALEAALLAAQAHRAQVVIVDITGIKNISANVCGTLIKMAAALRLLGAQAVLTGIRAEVAAALVGLGVELRSVVTRSTLQGGIAYALQSVKAAGWSPQP